MSDNPQPAIFIPIESVKLSRYDNQIMVHTGDQISELKDQIASIQDEIDKLRRQQTDTVQNAGYCIVDLDDYAKHADIGLRRAYYCFSHQCRHDECPKNTEAVGAGLFN